MIGAVHKSLPDLFAATCRRQPEAAAVACRTSTLTYAELAAAARGLASELVRRGVRRGDLVGLRVSRSADVPVAVLGVMLAGAAYVPLDPELPPERLSHITAEAGIACVVGEHLPARGHADAQDAPLPVVGPDDRAYVIYTSGSTGRPKGCVITHRNVLSLLGAALVLFDVGPADRWTLFHSINFDVSVWELWGAIATGGTAVVVDAEAAHDPVMFLRLLIEQRVTMLLMVPAVFRLLLDAYLDDGRPRHDLRYVIFAGEAVDLDAAATFTDGQADEVRLVNMYGPTETTVYATYKELDNAALRGANRSPIGYALPHVVISLRDDAGVEVTGGDSGEIWIAGGGVARGYLGREDLTAERFVSVGDVRYYRTGDLARREPDGSLEFLGRIDRQVKLRGFRIELAEIEGVLRKCTGVRDAVVEMASGHDLGDYLVAYVVTDDRFDAGLARAECQRLLPSHMLPSRYVERPAIPLTPSGKIDRAALVGR